MSCKSVKVIDKAQKVNHIAGLPNLPNYSVYSLNLQGTKEFKIESIEITNEDVKMPIKSYDFINLKNNSGNKVASYSKIFDIGKYKISFRLNKMSNKSKETVILVYSIKEEQFKINIPIKNIKQFIDK